MGFLGLFKKRPPDLRTLGQWLWNNDVALLDQTLQNVTVLLFKELVESGVINVACGSIHSNQPEVDAIAGHLTNLLDGRYLLASYEPRTTDKKLLSAAETTRDLILSGEYPELSAQSVMLGTLLAIRLWYAEQFADCIIIAGHVISIATRLGSAEAYRVRGFTFFALGDYDSALGDLLEAKRRQPGLVGINEPLDALAKLTKVPVESDAATYEPDGVRMGRDSLQTFSRVLHLAATLPRSTAQATNALTDFAARAREADAMIKSKVLGQRQLTVGDVADFAKCGMSAQIALMTHLLNTGKPGQAKLPTTTELRDAFAGCLMFLAGTQSINEGIDPGFAAVVRDFETLVQSLNARLDEFKFDLP